MGKDMAQMRLLQMSEADTVSDMSDDSIIIVEETEEINEGAKIQPGLLGDLPTGNDPLDNFHIVSGYMHSILAIR